VRPRRWSLHYALTETQWDGLRDRCKKLDPGWARCACPKRCRADTLDEQWRYDQATHTKILLGVAFICRGCHWLKTPPLRIRTWLELPEGVDPPSPKPVHVIACLGWTKQDLEALREEDLAKHQAETAQDDQLRQQVREKKAVILRAPPERLPRGGKGIRRGQIRVVPWRVNLSALARYGYSRGEIAVFQERMHELAARRMQEEITVGRG
jgi:hypothetical protein